MHMPTNINKFVFPDTDGKLGFSMFSKRPLELLTDTEREQIGTILNRVRNSLYQIQLYITREKFLSTKNDMINMSSTTFYQMKVDVEMVWKVDLISFAIVIVEAKKANAEAVMIDAEQTKVDVENVVVVA